MKKIIPIFIAIGILLGFTIKNSQWEFLGRAFYYIINKYVEKLDPQKVAENGIRGMVKKSLSAYIESTIENYKKRETKRLPGLKAFYKSDSMIITNIFSGTDAKNQGIKKGDLIVEIDGFPVRLATPQEALWRLYGEEGSTVTLRVLRKMKILDFKVKRDFPYKDFSIEGKRIEIYRLFRKTVDAIKSEANSRPRIILDLRNFIDGDWKASIALASFFTKEKTAVTIKNGEEKKDLYFMGSYPGKAVVVTDGTCTGACAVLAAILKAGGVPLVSTSEISGGCGLSPIKFEEKRLLLIPTIGIYVNNKDTCKDKIFPSRKTSSKTLIKEASSILERR